MKYFIFITMFLSSFLLATSCGEDEEVIMETEYDYHAHIHTPNAEDKHVGNTLEIDIDFESHAEQPVHHINVRIYNVLDNMEIYNKPDAAHVHATEGKHEFKDKFVLSNENGVEAHSDWVLEAKVWGEEGGEGEVIEKIEFHVHP